MVSRPARVQPETPVEPTKIKVMVVGDTNVGKTAFCKVASGGDYPVDSKPTVGSNYFMRIMKASGGIIQFNIFDMSGDPTYIEVRNEFYKES